MRIDASLSFVPIGANFSLVGAAGVSIPSPVTIDLLGVGVGMAPPNIIGTVALFGTDLGIGGKKQTIEVLIGTALASGNAATLNTALQLAPDTGAAGNYQPGTWQTVGETGADTVAQLPANTILRLEWPPVFPATLRPRFARLLFQVPAGTNFSAGTINSAFVTLVRDDLANRQASGNYTVR